MARRTAIGLWLLLFAACAHELSGPKPSLDGVDPPLVCTDQITTTVALSGSGFSPVTVKSLTGDPVLALPEISLIPNRTLEGGPPADPTPVVIPEDRLTWTSRSSMTIEISPELKLTPGVYDVQIENRNGNRDVLLEGLTAVPPPELEAVVPDLICNEQQDNLLTLEGSGFLDVNGTLPTIQIGDHDYTAESADGCVDVGGQGIQVKQCTSLQLTVEAGTLPEGSYPVSVTNTAPAECVSETLMLYVVPPPEITDVQTEPPCQADPTALMITGEDFLTVDGVDPTVTIKATVVNVTAMGGCTDYPGPTLPTRICTQITVAVPAGLISIGEYQVTVENPPPAGCSDTLVSSVGLPPTVDSVSPTRICVTGGHVTVNGSNFQEGATISIGGVELETTFVSDTELIANIHGDEGLPGGLHDVTVTNPDGCSATLEDAIQIVDLPLVYYVDPPVVYNGINNQVTVFATGVVGNVVDVSIRPTGQAGPVTALNFSHDPGRANRILAIIPAGTTPGDYDVIVEDDVGCVAELIDGLTITDSLTLALDRIEPPFGWTDRNTSVVLYALDPATPPDVQFEATPRAYLNPANPDPDTVATALESVAFVDSAKLNAVVPEGLPVDTYDLIVVNPSGAVGLLPAAFQVTAQAPPEVSSITPGSVIDQPGQDVDVEGSNFRNPQVEATCRAPNGSETPVTGTVNASTGENIDVTFDMGAVLAGSVCVVRVTNADGTYFDYSALSVTNPARNLSDFSAEAAMDQPRRGPAATAGRPTATARFLYALGGDDGSVAGAFDSVESAPVDPYGDLGGWFNQPYLLPGPRTMASAVSLGRFVYLPGGNDGSAAVNTVFRAEILVPGDSPDITDVDIRLGVGSGLAGGVWYYRVSAVFPHTDGRNPAGESLASDPLVIQIPDRPEGVHVTLVWSRVDRASGYRIYRSPDPDLISGSERLIAEVGDTPLTYTDEGDAAGAAAPLPFGSLGAWAEMPPMGAAREGTGLALARDPDAATTFYLYVLGGRDETGTALASYEYLPVQVNADGSHALGTWITGVNDLPAARWQLGAFVADHAHAAMVPAGSTWIYAGGGVDSDGTTMVRAVSAGKVQAGGDLGAWSEVDDMTPARAGYGYTCANSTLYAFGGQQAGASEGGVSNLITGPPDLDNWNNLGLTMTEPRYLTGSVTESAFIFLVGGWNGTAATASVEKTVW